MIFDDDKKTETEIVDQDQRPAVEEKIDITVDRVKNGIIDSTEWVADKIKEELSKEKKTDTVTSLPATDTEIVEKKQKEEKDPDPPPKEIMTAEPEKGPDPRPLKTQPESTGGFKKL